MDIIAVKDCIVKLVSEVGKCRREIESKGNARAKAISNYDMRIKIAIVTLKAEGKFPATLIEKIAKGVCAKDREDLEIAEAGYKAVICNLQALMAQMNAYQSILRFMDEA